MKALFKTEEELGIEQHVNGTETASHFEALVRCSSVCVEATRAGINLHTENIDPCSGAAYIGLPMQRAAGFASGKVGKRKSRVSRKVPIKVFSTDAENFMSMVHKLTGFQSSAYLLPGSPQTSLLNPFAARPLHPFVQGLYKPDSPAGDKKTANFSDDSFSCALSQITSSLSGRQQPDSINNVSLSTKEGLNTLYGPSSANRFPPSNHNPAFEALHSQGMRNSNSLDSRKEESFMDLFNEQRMLHKDVSAVSH